MDESSRRQIKRGENLVKSVMVANGVHKPSRRAVLLTTLASETFIGALTQDAVVLKSPNERLRARHLIHALAGSSRYSFVRNALHKFQAELTDAHQLLSKDRTIGFNKTEIMKSFNKAEMFLKRQTAPSRRDSNGRNLNPDLVSEPATNQNEEEDSKSQSAKEENNCNNTDPDVNFK